MQPVRRRRRIWPWALGVLLLAPLVLLALALEGAPRAGAPAAPDAADAVRVRDLAARVRDFIESEGAAGRIVVSEVEADAALRSAARLVAGLSGEAVVREEGVEGALSLGAPVLPEGWWLNVSGRLAASEDGVVLEEVRLGRLPVPGALVRAGLRAGVDRVVGAGTGAMLEAGVGAVLVAPPDVALVLDLDPGARAALFGRLRAQARALGGGVDRAAVGAHLDWLHDAAETGAVAEAGSVMPRVVGVLERAVAGGGGIEGLKAGFQALGLYCGSENFKAAIGMGMPTRMEGRRNRCKQKVTLGGRDDLKRHFLLSAGLQATTGGTATEGFGTLKELLDSSLGGSGFSFDDMAANRAGARLAAAFLGAPEADWPGMLARIGGEADVMPEVGDLPSRMPEAVFKARFGDLDSPAYAAMIAEIDRRIDALPFYRGL